MDIRTGRIYETKEAALAAGVPESDIAEIRHITMTLETARKRKRLSVTGLARLAQVGRATIQRLERGRALPQYETREALERVLGVRLRFSRAER